MPELAEVETVKETLKHQILLDTIMSVKVYYPAIVAFPSKQEFIECLHNEKISGMKRRGKWLIFELEHYALLSHLRMEGKYFIRNSGDPVSKHEHIAFILKSGRELRYHDTRKFGRMYLVKKEELEKCKPMQELGLEPWDKALTVNYLKEKLKRKNIPIKTVLLDQGIIAGLGNIYANEVLFDSQISPFQVASTLTDKQLSHIISSSQKILEKAIAAGGTTIHSFTSADGVHGRFQNELFVHGKEKEPCVRCGTLICKTRVNGRGTYYCPQCQVEIEK